MTKGDQSDHGGRPVTVHRFLRVADVDTAAVHHRCITRTALDALYGSNAEAETAWLSQITQI
jgi:hypothetical protein